MHILLGFHVPQLFPSFRSHDVFFKIYSLNDTKISSFSAHGLGMFVISSKSLSPLSSSQTRWLVFSQRLDGATKQRRPTMRYCAAVNEFAAKQRSHKYNVSMFFTQAIIRPTAIYYCC